MENEGASQDAGARPVGSPQTTSGGEAGSNTSPKKRRKVNHACIYCRRSVSHRTPVLHQVFRNHMTCDLERPCTRCVKRDIGHLCHDEPREAVRKSKGERSHTTGEDETPPKQEDQSTDRPVSSHDQQRMVDQKPLRQNGLDMVTPDTPADRKPNVRLAQSAPVSKAGIGTVGTGNQMIGGYNEWSLGGQNPFHDMHTFHPSYMFNAPEVTNEYNLLNDFLSTSLLDDGAMFSNDDAHGLYSESGTLTTVPASRSGSNGSYMTSVPQLLAPPQISTTQANSITRPPSVMPNDKAKETYYMTAADPSGSDTPETRIGRLLQAKYDAGMLRPFNYVKGYARLDQYMEKNMQAGSRHKILKQLEKFRPKFREAMHTLTDVQLVLVEMWFEKCLMEYDRVFASMAVPACCWRRTGEIFRGNREMAELIHVPMENLRDVSIGCVVLCFVFRSADLTKGKLALHEIIVEDHLVSYWEKFGAIAFDISQKAMLTSCSLKNPDLHSADPEIPCCFSFTIRRDEHNIPSLIVGNFLPVNPTKK
ncbi:hypothetical protein MMC13_000803 [Lambiella insularis]|nr:hypothetical protein [Lambiella insularis]